MQSEEIRGLVEEFFAARADDADAISAAVSDDVVWAPPAGAGIGDFHGRDAVVAALTGGDAGSAILYIHRQWLGQPARVRICSSRCRSLSLCRCWRSGPTTHAPTTDASLPSAVCRLPSAVCRLPSAATAS